MQYLLINENDTLLSLSKIVGQQNVEMLLVENGLKRTPKIGKAWAERCVSTIENTPNDISASRKSTLLNSLTGSEEVFEKACLMDEDEWKVFSSLQAFTDALRVPQAIRLPYSTKVIGDTLGDVEATLGVAGVMGDQTSSSASSNSSSTSSSSSSRSTSSTTNYASSQTATSTTKQAKLARSKTNTRSSSSDPVSAVTYKAVMRELSKSPTIDPSVFNDVNSQPPVKMDITSNKIEAHSSQFAYNIPWGKIQLYSSLMKESIDFPAYPEEIETSRSASYTAMPDLIYQYEPWIMYHSSGPREQGLNFHLHRDMWTGNHLDGNANRLIRFCEANTFPLYQGSSVLSPTVRLYIDGSLFISGVVTATNVNWSGPLGLDNWYLEFNLSLSIQEVSDTPLNLKTVSSMGLKGWNPEGSAV